jgi:hypothetical protein
MVSISWFSQYSSILWYLVLCLDLMLVVRFGLKSVVWIVASAIHKTKTL